MATNKSDISALAKREERLAYYLLLPTIFVVVVIALYPLASVVYNSFTDKTFASSAPTQFVGLQNYKQLLSVTIRQLQPVMDPQTGMQQINPTTGQAVYQSAIDVLPRSPVRYKSLFEFTLFGSKYVMGATDADFMRSVWDTILFTVASVVLELVLGLGIALVLNGFPAQSATRAILMAVMLVPWAIPTAVSSRIWQFMFGSTRTGFFNTILWYLHIGDGNIPFLSDPTFQVPVMIMVDVWKTTSFMALLTMAGLQLIPKDLYEASNVDGAGRWRQFWSITLPLLRGTIAVALVFRTLDALRVFDLFQIVLAQSRYSMASFTYYQLINSRTMGYSSASSVVIFVLILVFSILYIRMIGVETE